MNFMKKEHQKLMVKWEDDLLRSARFVVYDQALLGSADRGGNLGGREIQGVLD
jgi:hypothetical protein